MVRGSGSHQPSGRPLTFPVPTATTLVWFGTVRTGWWVHRRNAMTRNRHWPHGSVWAMVVDMQSVTSLPTRRHVGSLVGGTVVGASLVAAGLGLAFLIIDTPLVARLVPASLTGSPGTATAPMIWILAIIAGAGLVISGTKRLASTVAAVRPRSQHRSPMVRALATLPQEVVVETEVVLEDGRPIPELVIGPFGVAVVHELGGHRVLRRVGQSWETRTRDGWVPTEHPLDVVERDAGRVRHWIAHSDLGFVVRVHAALVTVDPSMLRSPLCAVITEDQIPAWIAALPRQRTLSAGRREYLRARFRASVVEDAQRDW